MSCFGQIWGVEFDRVLIDEAMIHGGLLSMELELSRRCNLACIYCYASSGRALPNELTLEEIFDVVRQAKSLGARKIIILGGGEPMLYECLFEVVDFILGLEIEVDIFTNGTLIGQWEAEALFERGVAVAVKLNSFDRDTQDALAGREGAFEAIQKGLSALMEAGYPDDRHRLGVETIICRHNYDEIPVIWRWARERNIVPYVETMTLQGRAREYPELEVGVSELQRLFERLSEIDMKEFGRNWFPHPPLAGSQCARHEYSCTVTSDGFVHPCPGVSIPVGNIRENRLADILNSSPVIRDLRDVRRKIKGHCRTCSLNALCYGCRGHAYQVTGDYLEADPICWLKNKKISLTTK